MDREVKEALEHLEEVSEENNRMLRSLYRTNRWSTVFTLIKWAVIIGVAIGAFYYLQPIFNKIDAIYNAMTNSHLPNFGTFFNQFK